MEIRKNQKQLIRRVTSGGMALLMVFSASGVTGTTFNGIVKPIVANAEVGDVVLEGECGEHGDNVTYKLTENGTNEQNKPTYTLTISGSGNMASYDVLSSRPWNSYYDGITKVVVEEGVTQLGMGSFKMCLSLNSVIISKSVTSICDTAFACSSIQTLTLMTDFSQKMEVGEFAFQSAEIENLYYYVEDEVDDEKIEAVFGTALGNAASATTINLNNAENTYTDEKGVQYSFARADDRSIYAVLSGVADDNKTSLASYDVPSEVYGVPVKEIGETTFNDCTSLGNVRYSCDINQKFKTNTLSVSFKPIHSDTNNDGFCNVCAQIIPQEPEKVDNVYQISNASELYWFAGLVNGTLDGVQRKIDANAVLTADITINGNVLNADGALNGTPAFKWTPIGGQGTTFVGKFDGQKYTISGLYFNDNTSDYVGLFGCVGVSGAVVENVNVVDSYFEGRYYVGGIAGRNIDQSVISNCTSSATVVGVGWVGGIAGINSRSSTIDNCVNTGNVTSSSYYVGGIAGMNTLSNDTTISNCHNSGSVAGGYAASYVGGIVGSFDSGTVKNCYNTGKCTAKCERAYVGGIAGGNSGTVEDCYNTADLSASGESSGVGGIAGLSNSGKLYNCYNTGNLTITCKRGFMAGVSCDNRLSTVISNCYNTGELTSTSTENDSIYIGGISCYSNKTTKVINCYNTGDIKSESTKSYVGGVVCEGHDSSVTQNCYNIGTITSNGDKSRTCGVIYFIEYGIKITNCYSLTNPLGYNYNTSGSNVENVSQLEIEQFRNGAAAYLLAKNSTEEVKFGQTIGIDGYPVLGGEEIFEVEAAYCGGTKDIIYSNTNANVEIHPDENNDSYCDKCGTLTDAIGVALRGYSLSLAGDIGVNFYMDLADAVVNDADAYMLFTLPNGDTAKVNVSNAKQIKENDKLYYVFTCNVSAKEMNSDIKAQMITANGNGEVYTYNVTDYITAMSERTNDENLKELLNAMAVYGNNAQTYFKYNADKTATVNDDTAANVDAITADDLVGYKDSNDKDGEFVLAGSDLTLKTKVKARVYFTANDDVNIDDYSVTVDGTALAFETKKLGEQTYYCVDLPEKAASKTFDAVTIVITKNDSTEQTFTYSAGSYCYNVLSRETDATATEELKALVRSLVYYQQTANIYVNGGIGDGKDDF